MNDKKTRCRYELNNESVKNILDDILVAEHIVFNDDNFETLLSKYLRIALDEFYVRQKLLEVIWEN